ncbi:hypothetical protein [Pedobacter nutrimenti]|uniref:BZIP transcription factor n=1 Tax=Pedobacter nutrimenti TaxID=1241337 RepID=A0A318UCT1_9SPHI|nr:hypothetical protein [Pedobacter nutrimenti]PYF74206.1 hypothetical protein B0O44_104377 [Pedobacter nutrimenti]
MKKILIGCLGLTIAVLTVKGQVYQDPNTGNVGIGTTTIDNLQSWNKVLQLHGSNHAKFLVTSGEGVKTGIFSHNGYNGKIGTESNHNLTLTAGYWNDVMTLTTAGDIGIGTLSPTEKLDVAGNIKWSGYNAGNPRGVKLGYSGGNYGGVGYNIEFTPVSGIFDRPFNDNSSYMEFRLGGFRFYGTNSTVSSAGVSLQGGGNNLNLFAEITSAGNFGIGITNPTEKLAVNGNIRAKEVKVENTNWPDYVFAKDYVLPSLKETEKHIQEKGHLPGIPSAQEVKSSGVDLGEMNAKLLKKIEELTLYLIEKEKKDTAQQEQINLLKSQMEKILGSESKLK